MSKIPFDIKFRPQIESGDYKVETQNGCIARIICWDRKDNNYPIVALFEEGKSGKECLLSYTQNGQHVKGTSNVSDLFIVTPEPELTEFEKAFDNLAESYHSDKNPDDVACCKEYAAELFSLARKQLQPEIDAEIEKAYKTADEVQYRKGREEALKDLPRWKKIRENGRNYSDSPQFVINGRYLEMNDTLNDVYEIALSDLAKLPKEDSHE